MTHPETPPSTDDLLRRGIDAAQSGDRTTARHLLEQALQIDERSEKAWFWLAAVVDSVDEKRICLGNVLMINPLNDRARRLLEQLERQAAPAAEGTPASEDSEPAPAAPAPPSTLNMALIVGVLAVIALVIVIALLLNRGGKPEPEPVVVPPAGQLAAQPTRTPGAGAGVPATPAETPTPGGPTRTPVPTWTPAPSATPLNRGPATPLAPPPTGLSGRIVMRSGLVLGDERLQPIVLAAPDGSQMRTVSEGGERGTAPALSPDGRYLAYVELTSTREQILKVLRLDRPGAAWFWGGTPRLIFQDMPSWSPDSAWIVFTATSFNDQLPDLYRVTGFGEGQVPALERLTQDNAIESWPSFSPDGSQVVYAVDDSASGGATELRMLDIASRQTRDLTSNGDALIESSPDWSPNPNRPFIVFHAREAGAEHSDIYWVRADGGQPPEKIIASDASDIHPRFSPDGRFILFSSNRTGNWDVFIYEIASGETFQVTTATTVEIAHDWAP